MYKILIIPDYVAKRINFALYPLGIQPSVISETKYTYTLDYERGLTLVVILSCIEYQKFFFVKKTKIWVSVHEKVNGPSQDIHQLSKFLPLPEHVNDIRFDIMFLARFASMSRAVADVLGAGECLTIKDD